METGGGLVLGGWCAVHAPAGLALPADQEHAGALTAAGAAWVEAALSLVIQQVHTSTACSSCYPEAQMHPQLSAGCQLLAELAARVPAVGLAIQWALGDGTLAIWRASRGHEEVSVLVWYATRRASAGLVAEPPRLWAAQEDPEAEVTWRSGEIWSTDEVAALREVLAADAAAAAVALALVPEATGWEAPELWAEALASGREAVVIVE